MDRKRFDATMRWLEKVYKCAVQAETQPSSVEKLFRICHAHERAHRSSKLGGKPKRSEFTVDHGARYFLVKCLYEMRDCSFVMFKDIAKLRSEYVAAAVIMSEERFRHRFETELRKEFPEALTLDVALSIVEDLDYIELLGE